MNAEEFFEYIVDKEKEKDKALMQYIKATENFYTITGFKYTDMPKSKGKVLGFDDLMANIEDLYNEYLEKKRQYLELYNFYLKYINKLSNKTHRIIIENFYIYGEKYKQLVDTLQSFFRIEYSIDYVRQLKFKAKKEFEKLIDDAAVTEIKELVASFDNKK